MIHERRKIRLALPSHAALRAALSDALSAAVGDGCTSYELTSDVCEAEIVITDGATASDDLSLLPDTVKFLQLVDCSSGAPHVTDADLTVANASSILASPAADRAIEMVQTVANQAEGSAHDIAGIIGFGTLGYEIGKRLSELASQIWVNDIRTPRQRSFQRIGARRSSLDMLLSTCDIVFVAIHHGPTSDPLLTTRELALLGTDTTIINFSDPRTIDIQAINDLNTEQGRRISYREIPQDTANEPLPRDVEPIAAWILDNLTQWTTDRQPRSIVETVTFPTAGDPAFWASRMAPRQTPV